MSFFRHSPENSFRPKPFQFGQWSTGWSIINAWGNSSLAESWHDFLWQATSTSESDETTRLHEAPQQQLSLDQKMEKSLLLLHEKIKHEVNSRFYSTVAEVLIGKVEDGYCTFAGCGDFTALKSTGSRSTLLFQQHPLEELSQRLPQNFLGSHIKPQIFTGKTELKQQQSLWIFSGPVEGELLASDTRPAIAKISVAKFKSMSPWWALEKQVQKNFIES